MLRQQPWASSAILRDPQGCSRVWLSWGSGEEPAMVSWAWALINRALGFPVYCFGIHCKYSCYGKGNQPAGEYFPSHILSRWAVAAGENWALGNAKVVWINSPVGKTPQQSCCVLDWLGGRQGRTRSWSCCACVGVTHQLRRPVCPQAARGHLQRAAPTWGCEGGCRWQWSPGHPALSLAWNHPQTGWALLQHSQVGCLVNSAQSFDTLAGFGGQRLLPLLAGDREVSPVLCWEERSTLAQLTGREEHLCARHAVRGTLWITQGIRGTLKGHWAAQQCLAEL